MATVPWLALAVLASGAVSAYFIRYLWPYRDTPGARFFIGTIACEALWAVAYGLALLVFDPALRRLFEIPIWIGIDFIGVFFLAFALEYTGRGDLVRSKAMGAIAALQVFHTAVVATNPLHGVAWQNYRVDPVLGAATVSYTHEPWLFVNFVGIYLMVAAGSFLLFDTFFSYGRLYRTQAAAVALSPVLPGLAFLAWLIGVDVSPPLNLTPLTFPIHLGFDMYAFFRRNMFEVTPAARRVSERTAIEDLGIAVIVVDANGRIVNHNDEAGRLFAPDSEGMIGRHLDDLGADIDRSADGGTVSVVTDRGRREHAVAVSELTDSVGTSVGHTITLQDVTSELRREQRLDVLNRVLRHNLRNDLNVVGMYLETAADRTDDASVREMLRTAKSTTEGVVDLGETARLIEEALDRDAASAGSTRAFDLLSDVRDDLLSSHPAGTVVLDVPDDVVLAGDRRLHDGLFRNLIENGLEHNDADEPTVEVVMVGRSDGGTATFEVRDDGPGLPDHERAVIEEGEETALEHGSGLGLWFVKWAADSLGGDVEFESDGAGTVVSVRLPTADDPG